MKYGESATLFFPIYRPNGEPVDNLVYARMCSAKIAKDGGTFAATTNSIDYAGEGLCSLTLTAQEMTCDDFVIAINAQNLGMTFTLPIIGETTRDVDVTDLEALTDKILGLAGHFSVTNNTLTTYDDAGVATGTYTLTRNSGGEITAIEPVVSNNGG